MRGWLAVFCLLLICPCFGQQEGARGNAPPDPFVINQFDQPNNPTGNTTTFGLTPRVQTFNSANRNLVLIMIGQSNCGNVNPTVFVPASAAVDQFNLYDGGSYNFSSTQGVLGPTNDGLGVSGGGLGNTGARLAQLFITNNIFDHVVLASICVGATPISGWAGTTGSGYNQRIPVIMKRLASRGITPTTTSWTFAVSQWQGENDNTGGTSSASYQASMALVKTEFQNAGFNCATCRYFVNEQSWSGGTTSAAVQAAQAAVVVSFPTFFFTGGNIDSLGAGDRLVDNTHLNDTGAAAAALLVYNAMVASGAPY